MEDLLGKVDFKKCNGLVPAVVQDIETGEVLMLAYMNREALLKTLETGYAHFWSRSRGKLWMKGETSGNVLKVIELKIDCDGDALLLLVKPTGPVCHTGSKTCFYRVLYRFKRSLTDSGEDNPYKYKDRAR